MSNTGSNQINEDMTREHHTSAQYHLRKITNTAMKYHNARNGTGTHQPTKLNEIQKVQSNTSHFQTRCYPLSYSQTFAQLHSTRR